MIDNINSVPARIVILGTSKMKLSERFNQLNNDNTNGHGSSSNNLVSKQRFAPETNQTNNYRRGYDPPVHKSSSSPFGNGGGGTLVSDNNGHYPMENSNSFLYDDYMSNDLFSGSRNNAANPSSRSYMSNGYRQQPTARKQQSRGYQPSYRQTYSSYVPADDYYDDEDLFTTDPLENVRDLDPLSLPLDTYRDLTRARRRGGRRPFQGLQSYYYSMPSRRLPKRGPLLANQIYEEYYQQRPSIRHRTTKRTPIHNRITIKRLARPVNFSKAYNNYRAPSNNFGRRGGGGGGPARFKRGGAGYGARFGAGNPRKTFNKQPQPKKKTPAELDKDLEMYMNSGKHPRVAPAVV